MRTLFFISDVIYWTQYNAEDIEVRAVSLFIPDYCKGQFRCSGTTAPIRVTIIQNAIYVHYLSQINLLDVLLI